MKSGPLRTHDDSEDQPNFSTRNSNLYSVFGTSSSTKLEGDVFSGQLSVHLTESVNLVINNGLLFGIQEDLGNLVAIDLGADTLSDNLSGVDEVVEKVLVNSGEGSGTRSLLGDARPPRRDGEDSAEGKEDNVSVGELLLEFAGKALLNFVELLEEWHWDKDDNSLLASTNLDLSCAVELQGPKGSLQVTNLSLEIVQCLSDGRLQFRGLGPRWGVVSDLDNGRHGDGFDGLVGGWWITKD